MQRQSGWRRIWNGWGKTDPYNYSSNHRPVISSDPEVLGGRSSTAILLKFVLDHFAFFSAYEYQSAAWVRDRLAPLSSLRCRYSEKSDQDPFTQSGDEPATQRNRIEEQCLSVIDVQQQHHHHHPEGKRILRREYKYGILEWNSTIMNAVVDIDLGRRILGIY